MPALPQVLKLRSNAKKCFDLSLGLAESLRPKDLSGEHTRAEHMPVLVGGMACGGGGSLDFPCVLSNCFVCQFLCATERKA